MNQWSTITHTQYCLHTQEVNLSVSTPRRYIEGETAQLHSWMLVVSFRPQPIYLGKKQRCRRNLGWGLLQKFWKQESLTDAGIRTLDSLYNPYNGYTIPATPARTLSLSLSHTHTHTHKYIKNIYILYICVCVCVYVWCVCVCLCILVDYIYT